VTRNLRKIIGIALPGIQLNGLQTQGEEMSSQNADFFVPQKSALSQAVSLALIAGVGPGTALAQDGELEEITVTATKRAESVMDVPLAITAMSGNQIREINLDDVKDLIAFTPGITGNSKDSFLDFVSVRGIRTIDYGNGGDPSVSIYKNGLYQGRTGSAVSSLYDVERAEVLRGPQGFLFGRNSVSGAINVITNKADIESQDGYMELDIGERGHAVFEGAVNIPTSDTFAIRLAGYHSEEDGYVKNLAGGPDLIGHDKSAIRASGRYETDNVTVDFLVEWEDRDQTGTVYRATGDGDSFNVVGTRLNGGVPIDYSSDERTVNNDNLFDSTDGGEIFFTALDISIDTDVGTFSSITGFKDYDYRYVEDYDAMPVVLFNYGQDQKGDYFEQEFRLTSNSDGPLSWYAGASFYQENVDTIFLGQQAEDAYCAAYWSGYYYANLTCQDVFDYYNYMTYLYPNGGYYGTDWAYYLPYYFGTTTWTASPDGLINDRNQIIGKYRGYSAYVDLSYEFSDAFDVSMGIRYTWDEKDFSQESLSDPGNSLLAYRVQTGFQTPNGPLRDKQDWNETTYRLVANWHPTDDTLIFGSITTGYKPGGFGSFNIEPGFPGELYGRYVVDYAVDRPGDFGPETVTAFELGFKGTMLDGRMQLNANTFFYDYEDLQAIYGEVGSPIQIVDNIGQVDGKGFEVDVNVALGDNMSARFGGSWLDTEANQVQGFCGEGERITGSVDVCEGNSIPWAPEYTAFAVINASFPTSKGEVFANLAWSWEDDFRGGWPDPKRHGPWPAGANVHQVIKAMNQTDLVVGYRAENWTVSAYVENLTDDTWFDGNYEDDDPASPYVEHAFGPSRPRTAGVRFSYEWGE